MFGDWDLGNLHITTLALALMALIGYLVGRLRRHRDEASLRGRRELRHAHAVARELERIAWVIRRNLSRHHASLTKFKQRVGTLSAEEQEDALKDLCREAAEVLTPTLRLSSQMAAAYDQIRQQTDQLMAVTTERTDLLTGLGNRRGLEEAIAGQFSLASRYGDEFSVVLFDVDRFKDLNDQQGDVQGDRLLQELARLLDESARETDMVGRYGGEEFLFVLPRTDLEGACIQAERIRARIEKELPVTVSAGVTMALDGDNLDSLIARADAALAQAKAVGRNCVFRHAGERAEPIFETAAV